MATLPAPGPLPERLPAIGELVQVRSRRSMDRAVLDAYGWTDIPTDCEFLFDYEIDDEEQASTPKKPYRYRWPDEVRDEMLARLLELNAQRAAAEERAGAAATPRPKAERALDSRSQETIRASIAAERGPLWGVPDE